MYFLSLTSLFLLLLACLTMGNVKQHVDDSIEKQLYISHVDHTRETISQNATVALENAKNPPSEKSKANGGSQKEGQSSGTTSKKEKGIKSLGVDLHRPPNNARLNVFLLLKEDPKDRSSPISRYELMAKLMRKLYSNYPFFNEIENAEYKIINKLIECREATAKFRTPDELATLVFDDPQLQQLFYLMLKGPSGAPSLLHYISFFENNQGEQSKINFLLAPRVIVEVILDSSPLVEELIEIRKNHWKAITYQETHRKEVPKERAIGRESFKTEFKKEIEGLLLRHGFSSEIVELFDFSLGKSGDFLFIDDATTHIILRQSLLVLN